MASSDKDKRDRAQAEAVYTTAEVITTNVYKVSPEQKEELDRLAEERRKRLHQEAILRIRERYEERVKEIRQQRERDGEGGTLPEKE
ncbi:hypothetical protein J31TS4_17130 [Paenibacillus sp. J31TS4]|uniref:hypothetical protein n=1 Tax=Paenibacillus sp. J31TS4 TaxID=2807195 RepID=UPI001B23F982|nr:hypothetical protein [Paenibacillus sp. J31TS4]GIP38433.1 hypothetical protein J31TS4_17130 [Paenibacillus sp. J31TS4]